MVTVTNTGFGVSTYVDITCEADDRIVVESEVGVGVEEEDDRDVELLV